MLRWPITTRSTLAQGLYSYDAIGRLQDTPAKSFQANGSSKKGSSPDIGRYLHLGPLGTALLPVKYPRVLLIDEIDKSDIDLPNDLLNVFEEGEFEIPELVRVAEKEPEVYVMPADGKDDKDRVPIKKGHVQCHAFPFIVLTSNGEREFPPAFLRRCLQLELQPPKPKQLAEIVNAHFDDLKEQEQNQVQQLISLFLEHRDKNKEVLATDQLLNIVYMIFRAKGITLQDKEKILNLLVRPLSTSTSSNQGS